MVCPRVYDEPVCASDGNTYVNECIMKTIGNLIRVHEGPCGKLNLNTFQTNIVQVSPSTLYVVRKYEIFLKKQTQIINIYVFTDFCYQLHYEKT